MNGATNQPNFEIDIEPLVNSYNPIGLKIDEIAQKINIFSNFLTPSGKAIDAQIEAFLKNECDDIEYEVAPPTVDTANLLEQLGSIRLPGLDDDLDELIENQINFVRLQIELVSNFGNREVMLEVGRKLYGAPSSELVEIAEDLLKNTPETPLAWDKTADDVASKIQEFLNQFGLADTWKIVRRNDSKGFAVNEAQHEIYVPAQELNRKFWSGEPDYLTFHEVGVHVLGSANGERQPVLGNLLRLGLAGYEIDHEGLGIYAGEVTNTLATKSLHAIASHVIVADSLFKGQSFREAFTKLNDLSAPIGVDQKVVVERVLRGYYGGTGRDQAYLKGLINIRKFVDEGGNLRDLYVGKVSVGDLPLLGRLKDKGLLTEGEYFPKFFCN